MADTKLTGLTELSVPDLADWLYAVDLSDTTDDAAGSSRKMSLTRNLGLLNHVCQGRLTLTSGTAVTTADVTGATNVYFTPYGGQCISLYDGTRWRMYTFTELTLALGTLTAALPYDVFVYDNAGTLTLEALAWNSASARTTALAITNGVPLKTGALTRRYLGTFYTTATTTTEDSAAKRFLWNANNRALRALKRQDTTTTTYTYTTDTWRQANADTANQVEFVIGIAGDSVRADVMTRAANSTGSIGREVSLGVDSTSSPHADATIMRAGPSNTTDTFALESFLNTHPAVGYHYVAWLERSTATGTCTWTMKLATTQHQSGMSGSLLA